MFKSFMALMCALVVIGAQAKPLSFRNSKGDEVSKKINVQEPFTKVEAGGVFEVEIRKGAPGVTVIALSDLVDKVKVTVTNGVLQLNLDKYSGVVNSLKVKITMPGLDGIKASGASEFEVKSDFDGKNMLMKCSGSSSVEVETLTFASLELDMSGASEFEARQLNLGDCVVGMSGSSEADMEALKSVNVKIKMSGASECEIESLDCDEVDASCSGSSELALKGVSASKVKCGTSGSSDISLSGQCGRAVFNASGSSEIKAKKLRCDDITSKESAAASISTSGTK
ncbi:MAG: DUF2807 domain-containing protein [Clostridiales bacterium]|nr:DUF2807 domain-containing protein [Clostridiales bacterium]